MSDEDVRVRPVKKPAAEACVSCPYRVDVPPGVWAASEYEKLPLYDNDTFAQPTQVFLCHQRNGRACSGWAGCHGSQDRGRDLLSLRLGGWSGLVSGEVADAIIDYVSPVPLFGSGAAAAEHGLSGIEDPDERAVALMAKLVRQRTLRERRKAARRDGV